MKIKLYSLPLFHFKRFFVKANTLSFPGIWSNIISSILVLWDPPVSQNKSFRSNVWTNLSTYNKFNNSNYICHWKTNTLNQYINIYNNGLYIFWLIIFTVSRTFNRLLLFSILRYYNYFFDWYSNLVSGYHAGTHLLWVV